MVQEEYDEKRALEESLALFELQERDSNSFPALPVSLEDVLFCQWGLISCIVLLTLSLRIEHLFRLIWRITNVYVYDSYYEALFSLVVSGTPVWSHQLGKSS